MNNLTMIAAVGKNLELGKKNELIWHFKEDMTFFKNNTINKTVVMGRNTYESIGRDLPNRKNIVLMFLIIMLSFAKTIEVSAETNDDADVGESGLNDLTGLFNPKDHKCRAKDFDIS